MAKIDVIEERLSNQIWLFYLATTLATGWLIYLTLALVSIQTRLSGIDVTLKQISTTQTLQRTILAGAKDAPSALEAAQKAIAAATSEHIHVDPGLAIDVAKKAVAVAEQPNDPSVQTAAWRTVGAAVSYASSPKIPVSSSSAKIPDCMETLYSSDLLGTGRPTATFWPPGPGSKILTIPTKQFLKGCMLDLDGAYTRASLKGVVLKFVQPLNLEDCLIVYNGGRPLLAGELIFKNCTFVIKIDAPPPLGGQQFAGTLVASDLMSANIPTPPVGS